MLKRATASVLWFFAGWTAASVLAFLTGFPGALAPLVGLVCGAVVAMDPLHLLWPAAVRPAGAPAHQGHIGSTVS